VATASVVVLVNVVVQSLPLPNKMPCIESDVDMYALYPLSTLNSAVNNVAFVSKVVNSATEEISANKIIFFMVLLSKGYVYSDNNEII